ncbi:MAG: uracil-DNA glycosylase [Prochloraceae cyanobacterium]|nr:uracil-DNA glycosylase [Prochloraceae cyanobacterium]
MLTQFKNCYPRANLITELVEIDCDRYIVKASVIIDGIIIATGMAGEGTIELAQERAIERALALLNLNMPLNKSSPTTKPASAKKITKNIHDRPSNMTNSLIKSDSWNKLLAAEIEKDYFLKLQQFLAAERQQYQVFPPQAEIFAALEIAPLAKIKVVILGQDPYHNVGQAHGLSFSVKKGVRIPASLKNIFQELKDDLNITAPKHGNLSHWASQGVLLLNTVLTVRAHKANSHKNKGWETFTDRIIEIVNEHNSHVVFVFWGKEAQKKIPAIDNQKHTIIKSPHPSPFSAKSGFFGSQPFSKINSALEKANQTAIDWNLPE